MYDISDVINDRTDIDEYLVHLTKDTGETDAKSNLKKILREKKLVSSEDNHCSIQYAFSEEERISIRSEGGFSSICFTETPLNNIKSMTFTIKYRKIKLTQYGLAFYKEPLRKKGVSPIFYLNNFNDETEESIKKIVDFLKTDPILSKTILPLLGHIGNYIIAPGYCTRKAGVLDFSWEREWRFPHNRGDLNFGYDEICTGLCKSDDIEEFETEFSNIIFIDPTHDYDENRAKIIESETRKKEREEEDRKKRDPWSGKLLESCE
jgi:hypothetical protein